jgi:predicted AlkP superfamily phosphohydrolase/phosphomutase
MQHYVWPYLDRSHPDFEETGFSLAGEFYRSCDNIIRELVETAGEDSLVLIVSDHGFCRLKYRLRLNSWLRQKGYLKVFPQVSKKSLKQSLKDNIYPLKLAAMFYGKYLKRKPKKGDWAEFMLNNLRANLDIENSKCFALGGSGGLLYFNMPDHEKPIFFERLKNELLADFGEEAENFCIKSIRKATDLYGVEDNEYLPDMVCTFAEGVFAELTPVSDSLVAGPEKFSSDKVALTGTHSQDGVIVAYGDKVKQGAKIDNASIVDIMPTVLAYMGIDVPDNIDGRVLTEIFTDKIAVNFKNYSKTSGTPTNQDNYSDSEKDEIEQELANLGYM